MLVVVRSLKSRWVSRVRSSSGWRVGMGMRKIITKSQAWASCPGARPVLDRQIEKGSSKSSAIV